MEDTLHQNQVDEHISALRHEGDRLRAERLAHERGTTQAGPAVAGGRAGDHPPARVRLGRWLIDVGTAVAGTATAGTNRDQQDGATGRAA